MSPQRRKYDFANLFNVCKGIESLKQLHAQLIVNCLHGHLFLRSKLVDVYVHSGSLFDARKAFDEIPHRNNRSWNTIFSGYSKHRLHSETLGLCRCMRREGLHCDSFTLVFAIKACIGLTSFKAGESFCAYAIKICLDKDAYFVPNMVKMYVECGSLDQARKLFDETPLRNSVLFGAMVQGYVKSCKELEALQLFHQMQQDGVQIDAFLVMGLLRACGSLSAGREGRSLHAYAIRMGFLDSNMNTTCLVDMYLRCKCIVYAHEVFKQIQHKDVVAWTAMISGLLINGKPIDALDLFQSMLTAPANPNTITLSSVLGCCSDLGALQIGKRIHAFATRKALELNVILGTSLIDMYWKCGCEQYAGRVFDMMPEKNVCSWTAMLAGYGTQGKIHEALSVFERMVAAGHRPNAITFVSLLSICSHSGLIDEGWSYFQSMSVDYCIAPCEEHYACMVDMLARAGFVEAERFIENMPIEPGASVWGAILAGCVIHMNVELAERAAKKLFVLEPDRMDAHVLLSNLYEAAGLLDQSKKLMRLALMGNMGKTPGYSSI